MIGMQFKWSKDYPARQLYIWSKKALWCLQFNESGNPLSLDKEPIAIGILAPESLIFDGTGFWWLGKEKQKIGIYYFDPQRGNPRRIDDTVIFIDLLRKKNLDRAIGWLDPETNSYRINIPEFES
jgi:hypothetical protein